MRLRLQERALADYLFNEFEQSFYQINRARSLFDKRLQNFYGEVLDFFTHFLLQNPGLLYYWSKDGGQLCFNYEPSTIAFYEANVLNNRTFPYKIRARYNRTIRRFRVKFKFNSTKKSRIIHYF